MNTKSIAIFIRQPSTVLGLSALVGTLTAFLTGEITWQGAVPAIAGAIAAVVLPDNSGAQAAIKDAATAIVAAEAAIATSPAKTTVAADGAKVAAKVTPLVAIGFGLFACALQPSAHTQSVEALRIAYTTAHAAKTGFMASVNGDPVIGVQLARIDESARTALAAYETTPGGDVQAQAAEMAISALAIHGATRTIR